MNNFNLQTLIENCFQLIFIKQLIVSSHTTPLNCVKGYFVSFITLFLRLFVQEQRGKHALSVESHIQMIQLNTTRSFYITAVSEPTQYCPADFSGKMMKRFFLNNESQKNFQLNIARGKIVQLFSSTIVRRSRALFNWGTFEKVLKKCPILKLPQ